MKLFKIFESWRQRNKKEKFIFLLRKTTNLLTILKQLNSNWIVWKLFYPQTASNDNKQLKHHYSICILFSIILPNFENRKPNILKSIYTLSSSCPRVKNVF